MNTKVLILPDIHNKWKIADAIINKESPDRIICLGDYFDSYQESSDCHIHTAQWLKAHVHQKNFIALRGNHDVPYEFAVTENTHCPGYTKEKRIEIRKILGTAEWYKLHWFYILDGWIFSHAGVTRPYAPPIGSIEDYLNKSEERATIAAQSGDKHWFFAIGNRMGRSVFGGLTWCDFPTEFIPIEGVRQIFGHSFDAIPRWIRGGPSYINTDKPTEYVNDTLFVDGNPVEGKDWNLCLDTYLKYYAILQDGKLTIKRYQPSL